MRANPESNPHSGYHHHPAKVRLYCTVADHAEIRNSGRSTGGTSKHLAAVPAGVDGDGLLGAACENMSRLTERDGWTCTLSFTFTHSYSGCCGFHISSHGVLQLPNELHHHVAFIIWRMLDG